MSWEHLGRIVARFSPSLADRILKWMASSTALDRILSRIEAHRLGKITAPRSILVIPDINIGDAVLVQSLVDGLKYLRPDLKIGYAYQRQAYPLIKANPHIDVHFPFVDTIGFPSQKDLRELEALLKKQEFDVILNLCPYFTAGHFQDTSSDLIFPIRMVNGIIRSYLSDRPAHIAYHMKKYSQGIISQIPDTQAETAKNGHPIPHIFMSETLPSELAKIRARLHIPENIRMIMFNPDSSSRFTLIPKPLQVKLLEGLLSLTEFDLLLMNRGFTFAGIEEDILAQLPLPLRKKVVILPKETPIDVFAALLDKADVFISGDTGPLHIAAARKYMPGSPHEFRNATALVGLFGATSGRIYGYDSHSLGYFPSAQDAPAKIFEGQPRCKNLTCIDKLFKTCPEVRCFEGIEPVQVVAHIRDTLASSLA